MVDYTSAQLPEYLTLNCSCFQHEDFAPGKALPKQPSEYVKQVKKRINSMLREIDTHRSVFRFNDQEVKPCYGVSVTTGFTLRCALFRHQHTLKKLKETLRKNDSNIYIRFDNGKEVSVEVYHQIVKQIVTTNIQSLETCQDCHSPICVDVLTRAEKQHRASIEVLENVVRCLKLGLNQLEISVEPPIGVY